MEFEAGIKCKNKIENIYKDRKSVEPIYMEIKNNKK